MYILIGLIVLLVFGFLHSALCLYEGHPVDPEIATIIRKIQKWVIIVGALILGIVAIGLIIIVPLMIIDCFNLFSFKFLGPCMGP